jgi:hypothetical protein
MLARLALLCVVALNLASCSGPCTLIGCNSGVTITLASRELVTLSEGESVLRLCIATNCTQATVDGSGGNFFTAQFELNGAVLRANRSEVQALDKADVSFTITREGTERFTRTWQGVKFVGQSPNGPGCGEACRVATLDANTP